MPLPKLEHSKFKAKLPSTGKDIWFRPFTVGEEKILLTTLEGGETEEIINSVNALVSSCIVDELNETDLTSFDVEYMFLQIRSKSVSPTVEMSYRNQSCEMYNNGPCEESIRVLVNLEDAKIVEKTKDGIVDFTTKKPKDRLVKLNERVAVQMGYPKATDLVELSKLQGIELFNKTIMSSIEVVYDGETANTKDDFTPDELNEWFENELTSLDKNKLAKFTTSTPVLRHELEIGCKKCGYKEKVEFEGLQSFFD